MNKKRNTVGQTLGMGIIMLLLVAILSCAFTALLVGKETISEKTAVNLCWIITIMGTYFVSWYTAKKSDKNKMQTAATIIGVFELICVVAGRMIFSDMEMKITIWMPMMIAAMVVGGMTARVKKERKR